MTARAALHKTLTTRTAVIGALILVLLGGIALLISVSLNNTESPVTSAFTRELGALLIVSGVVTIGWDLIAKRAFKDELLADIDLKVDIERSGIVQLPEDFGKDIPWTELLSGAQKVDLFFAYARTWRGMNVESLRSLARTTAEVRVLLPDPEVDAILHALAMNFERDGEPVEDAKDRVKHEIRNAESDFRDIFCAPESTAAFQLSYYTKVPVFSAYRIDDSSIIAFYKHRKGRGGVPSFLARAPGSLYQFVTAELDYLLDAESPDSRVAVTHPARG